MGTGTARETGTETQSDSDRGVRVRALSSKPRAPRIFDLTGLDPGRREPSSDFSTLRRAARDHAGHQRRMREAADSESDPRPKLPPVAAAAAGQ
jgi:hypothetical protein